MPVFGQSMQGLQSNSMILLVYLSQKLQTAEMLSNVPTLTTVYHDVAGKKPLPSSGTNKQAHVTCSPMILEPIKDQDHELLISSAQV